MLHPKISSMPIVIRDDFHRILDKGKLVFDVWDNHRKKLMLAICTIKRSDYQEEKAHWHWHKFIMAYKNAASSGNPTAAMMARRMALHTDSIYTTRILTMSAPRITRGTIRIIRTLRNTGICEVANLIGKADAKYEYHNIIHAGAFFQLLRTGAYFMYNDELIQMSHVTASCIPNFDILDVEYIPYDLDDTQLQEICESDLRKTIARKNISALRERKKEVAVTE